MATPATPETERKKGPWAHRVLSSEIESTPEYEEFMKGLTEYHEKRGTTLIRVPELGRKLLDLQKLYKKVTELGGYDKVTEQKGAWRDLANFYNPPVNNSNAGYTLKSIYYKNLAAYEIANFFNKEPPPKEWLEDRSAAGGAIMTRTPEDFLANSPKPDANGDSASPPPTDGRRSLRQQPTPRSFYAPDTTPQRQNPPRSGQHQNMHQQAQHDGVIGNAPFPYFVQPSSTLPSIRQVQTPQTTPAAPTANNRPFGIGHQAAVNPNKIGGGHPGSNQMHRILMSLKCGMPDQVKWALAQLVCISYESGDELRADHWSGLCELLFNKLRSVSQLVKDYGHLDGLENPRFNEQLERINETALILRNMACIDNNARIFASAHDPKDIIVDGLRLMPLPKLNEFKNYLLDMTDSMAKYLPYLPDDPLLEILARNLESDDRGTLLVSIRSITRALFGRDDSNIIVRISPSSVRRMMSLLMLEDDELVSTCLDFFYHFTSLARNVELLLEPPDGSEFVRHLVRLLLFQGVTGEQLVYIKMFKKTRPPVHEIPQLSESIVRELIGFAEPERATKWMRCCFEEDPDADITQIALWQAYQARFNEFVTQGFPLLPAAEFIKNVSVAFQNASAMVLPCPSGGQKFIIKGIRARETPMDTKGLIYLSCKWFETPGNAVTRCTAQLPTPRDLWDHIVRTHLFPPLPDSVDGAVITSHHSQPLLCKWAGCPRFSPHGETNRIHVVAHVRTHMPDKNPTPSTISREEQEMMDDPEARVIIRRCQTQTDEKGEATGIPLTSVLILRNMKEKGGDTMLRLLENCRDQLFEVMAINKPLASYCADLVNNLYPL